MDAPYKIKQKMLLLPQAVGNSFTPCRHLPGSRCSQQPPPQHRRTPSAGLRLSNLPPAAREDTAEGASRGWDPWDAPGHHSNAWRCGRLPRLHHSPGMLHQHPRGLGKPWCHRRSSAQGSPSPRCPTTSLPADRPSVTAGK